MTEDLTGSVQKKGGVYYAVINYHDPCGKRKQKWVNTHLPIKNNRRNAEKFLERAIEEFEQELNTPHSEVLYCDYLVQWMSICKPSWSPKTYEAYSNIVNRQIIPYFKAMNLRLEDIKAYHIQSYYQKKLEVDKVKSQTVMRHHAVIHKSLKDAVRMDMIPSNPAEKVILPKTEKFIGNFYTVEEIDALLEAAKGTPLETPILLTVYYGLRRSEVTGLRWSSIDFANKTVSIENKLVQMIGGNGKSKIKASQTMKTDSSLRTLPLIDKVEQYLKDLKKQQERDEKTFGNSYNREYDGYICRWPDGKLIAPNYITTRFPYLLAKHGLRKIRFHDLRHSCASLLLSLGFSIKDIQVWLGHHNFSTTADIYSHLDYKSKVALAEKLGQTISSSSGTSGLENRLENG